MVLRWQRALAIRIAVMVSLLVSANAHIFAQSDQQVANRLRIRPEMVERLNTHFSLTNVALNQLPLELLPRLIQRLEHPEIPWKRVAFRLLQERDENGIIPADAIPKALAQLDSLRARTIRTTVAGVPVARRTIAPAQLGAILLPPTAWRFSLSKTSGDAASRLLF